MVPVCALTSRLTRMIRPRLGYVASSAWIYCTGSAPLFWRPAITAEILAAFWRYWFSLIEKYARIGSTLEMVVIFVVGPTRSPTWAVATPATPPMGQYTF